MTDKRLFAFEGENVVSMTVSVKCPMCKKRDSVFFILSGKIACLFCYLKQAGITNLNNITLNEIYKFSLKRGFEDKESMT